MPDPYKELYTKFIMADVENGTLDKEMVQGMQKHLAAQPDTDPAYLASLNEAIKLLYGPEEIMKRMRDRE